MRLPKEYRKFIGKYDACKNPYGRKMLRKFGFGPETKIVSHKKAKVEEAKKLLKKPSQRKPQRQRRRLLNKVEFHS